MPPGNFLKWMCAKMQSGAFWDNFEKCYSVCTDLVASGWFFRYSLLYWWQFFLGGGGWSAFLGGSFYPSNTLDGTLLLRLLLLPLPSSVSVTPPLLMTARLALVGRLNLVSPILREHDQELGVKENMRSYRSWNLESHENLEFHFLGLERHGI